MQTHDCEPTLTDTQVLEFCKTGYHMIEAAVPPKINERVVAAMDEQWDRGGRQMHSFTEQDWFVESVLANPAAAGAARSLLGANFALPNWATWFREESPVPANQWHIDGGSMFDGQMNTLKWFYYPTACPEAMGPTEFVPGSHHVTNQVRFMAHYDSIRGTWKSTAPAGSIYFTAYPMWHRRANATATGLRYMLTGTYHRTVPPTRDWIREPDFDFATADYWLAGAALRGAVPQLARRRQPVHVAVRAWRQVRGARGSGLADAGGDLGTPLRRAGRLVGEEINP